MCSFIDTPKQDGYGESKISRFVFSSYIDVKKIVVMSFNFHQKIQAEIYSSKLLPCVIYVFHFFMTKKKKHFLVR